MPKEIDLGKRIIDFMGPEGSGKTYHAINLANQSGKPYISVGDILRDIAKTDSSELGKKVRDMFEKHVYLDPETLLLIQEKYFSELCGIKNGFILDGGLRSVEETIGFPEVLKKAHLKMPVDVIHLRIPGWMSFERLGSENGRKREDDTLEGVLSRLSNYYKNLAIRASTIQNLKGFTLIHVNSTESRDVTSERILSALKKTSKPQK